MRLLHIDWLASTIVSVHHWSTANPWLSNRCVCVQRAESTCEAQGPAHHTRRASTRGHVQMPRRSTACARERPLRWRFSPLAQLMFPHRTPAPRWDLCWPSPRKTSNVLLCTLHWPLRCLITALVLLLCHRLLTSQPPPNYRLLERRDSVIHSEAPTTWHKRCSIWIEWMSQLFIHESGFCVETCMIMKCENILRSDT